MKQLGPSIIRTVVPWIVGMLVTSLAERGLSFPDGAADEIVTVVVSALYYGVVRVLETRLAPVWGWLLGSTKQPVYVRTQQPLVARHFTSDYPKRGKDDGPEKPDGIWDGI